MLRLSTNIYNNPKVPDRTLKKTAYLFFLFLPLCFTHYSTSKGLCNTMAEYYASIPTYIPPVTPGFDFPAYVPATTELTRSRSNRIVYADDPWNSAGNPELFTPLRRQSRDRAQQPRRLTKRPVSIASHTFYLNPLTCAT